MFDLEYGQPAASTSLPASRPAFRDFLGCYGHADIGKGLAESGVDLLYASHQVSHLSSCPYPWHLAPCCCTLPASPDMHCNFSPLACLPLQHLAGGRVVVANL